MARLKFQIMIHDDIHESELFTVESLAVHKFTQVLRESRFKSAIFAGNIKVTAFDGKQKKRAEEKRSGDAIRTEGAVFFEASSPDDLRSWWKKPPLLAGKF